MGQPVDSEKEDEGGEEASGSDDEEGEAGGDTSAGRGGEDGGNDGEEVAEEDSASLVHPVTKVTFDLMRKLRELPISGGSFGAGALFFLLCSLALVGPALYSGRPCGVGRLQRQAPAVGLWGVGIVQALARGSGPCHVRAAAHTTSLLFKVSSRLLTQLLRGCASCSHVPLPLICLSACTCWTAPQPRLSSGMALCARAVT